MKILVLCVHGKNRSRFLAEYLAKKGYDVSFAGVGAEDPETLRDRISRADVLITVHPMVREKLEMMSIQPDTKIITLDVDDRPEHVLTEKTPLTGQAWTRFQETHVYPKLIEAVERHLPFRT